MRKLKLPFYRYFYESYVLWIPSNLEISWNIILYDVVFSSGWVIVKKKKSQDLLSWCQIYIADREGMNSQE